MSQILFLDKTFFGSLIALGCEPTANSSLDELIGKFSHEDANLVVTQTCNLVKLRPFSMSGLLPYKTGYNGLVNAEDVPIFFDQATGIESRIDRLDVIVCLNGDVIVTDYTEAEGPLKDRLLSAMGEILGVDETLKTPLWKFVNTH